MPSVLEIVLYIIIGLATTFYVANGIVKIKTGHGIFSKKKKTKDNEEEDE